VDLGLGCFGLIHLAIGKGTTYGLARAFMEGFIRREAGSCALGIEVQDWKGTVRKWLLGFEMARLAVGFFFSGMG
jgi:hypothetical protein